MAKWDVIILMLGTNDAKVLGLGSGFGLGHLLGVGDDSGGALLTMATGVISS